MFIQHTIRTWNLGQIIALLWYSSSRTQMALNLEEQWQPCLFSDHLMWTPRWVMQGKGQVATNLSSWGMSHAHSFSHMFSYANNFRVSFDPNPLLPALRTRWGTGTPRSKEGKAPLFIRGENTRHKGELGRPAEQLGISKCCSGQRKQNAEHVWKSSVCFRKYSCKSTQIFDHPNQIQLSCPLRFSVSASGRLLLGPLSHLQAMPS